MNSRSSIDFLMENMEDWDDLSPTIEISGKYSTGSAIADYGADTNTIRLNWHNRSWYGRDLPWDSGQLDDYSMRNLVGQSPQSHIVHEYGHTRHMTEMIRTGRLEWIEDPDDLGYFWEMRDPDGNFRQWGGDILSDGWLSNGERLTAHRVSTYAAENPSEFVAETHTALIMGESFPDDVMDLYRHLGGTVPSQSEMDAWAVATGREIDLDDDEMFFDIDVHGQDVFGDEYDDIARTLGLSRDEYDDMVNRGVQQLLISEEDMFDDMMLDVDFMRNIIDKLED